MEIDFYSKQQTDSKLDEKANSDDVYKKNETYDIEEINNIIDTKIAEIQIPDVSDFYTKSEVYTKTQVDNLLTPKANANDVYTKTQVDNLVSPKANSSDVYSKSETYTKTEVGNLVSPKANSSDVYTKTETDNLVSPKANSSDVYTKTQVDNIIGALPVFSGIIRTDLSTSVSVTGNYGKITISNLPTLKNGDIIAVGGEYYFDNGNIDMGRRLYLLYVTVKNGNTYISYVRDVVKTVNTSSDYLLDISMYSNEITIGCYEGQTVKAFLNATDVMVSVYQKGA